jgi:hypothetical protein
LVRFFNVAYAAIKKGLNLQTESDQQSFLPNHFSLIFN